MSSFHKSRVFEATLLDVKFKENSLFSKFESPKEVLIDAMKELSSDVSFSLQPILSVIQHVQHLDPNTKEVLSFHPSLRLTLYPEVMLDGSKCNPHQSVSFLIPRDKQKNRFELDFQKLFERIKKTEVLAHCFSENDKGPTFACAFDFTMHFIREKPIAPSAHHLLTSVSVDADRDSRNYTSYVLSSTIAHIIQKTWKMSFYDVGCPTTSTTSTTPSTTEDDSNA